MFKMNISNEQKTVIASSSAKSPGFHDKKRRETRASKDKSLVLKSYQDTGTQMTGYKF